MTKTKSITITDEQAKFVKENAINLSRLVQLRINELIAQKQEKPEQLPRKSSP
jgi:post-segregation antitoxin (ccd killing protein)